MLMKLILPVIGAKANLYSCVQTSKTGELKVIPRANQNNRDQRKRPELTEKGAPVLVHAKNDSQDLKRPGEYGMMWA